MNTIDLPLSSPNTLPGLPPAFAASRSTSRTLWRIASPHLGLLLLATAICVIGMRPAWHRISVAAGPALALATAALLLALTALAATLLLTIARRRSSDAIVAGSSGRVAVVWVAGAPQALLLLAGSILSGTIAWVGWLRPAFATGNDGLSCAVLLLLASFPLLVAERAAAAVPRSQLPEAPALAAVLRLPVVTCLALAVAAGVASTGIHTAAWGSRLVALLLLAAAGETALRTLGIWFAPPPLPTEARARIGSLVVLAFRPGSLSAAAASRTMRTQFGIDFSRSWALAFVRQAALPVLATLLCLAWLLSGVVRVGLDQRAVYERFGAPVSVLQPGLHLLLPWPLGRARSTEYGVIHAVAVSDEVFGVAAGASTPAGRASVEGPAPASASRLWDQSSPDISYLVARSQDGRQSFESVSVDLRVLYRVGLDDRSARAVSYRTADPASLVLVLSRRLLAHFFAGETLAGVMDERRERIADGLRLSLQRQLDAIGSGVVVTGLVIDSLHPPVGAASAYREVQAAEIQARTAVAEERGRASGILSVARRDAHDTLAQAGALSAELVAAARADDLRMGGDVRAWHAGGPAFLLERRLHDLTGSLPGAALEIIDSRLGDGAIDLRQSTAPADVTLPSSNGAMPTP